MDNQLTQAVQALLSGREQVHGTFSPQAYAIGLLGSPYKLARKLAASGLEYPLKVDDESKLALFKEALVLYHESTHFLQFITTSLGLQMARMTNICANRLIDNGPWKLPVLGLGWNQYGGEDIDRFFAFRYLMDALRPTEKRYATPAGVDWGRVTLVACPTSPLRYLLPPDADIASFREVTKAVNGQTHAEYHVLRGLEPGIVSDVTLNTAAIMESYALVAELHHMLNALQLNADEVIKVMMARLPIYNAVPLVYSLVFKLPLQFMLLHLAALIDIALMYSPHIIYNIGPAHALTDGGGDYRTPGEIFVNACIATRSITPMKDYSRPETQRFQDEVCAALKIQTTAQMTDLCLERLAKLGLRTRKDCDAMLMDTTPFNAGKQLALHWIGLNYRKEYGDGFFYDAFKTDQLSEILELADKHVTFFDLESRMPYSFHPGRIYYSSQTALVWDALHAPRLTCPLKHGRPYFCPSANTPSTSLCTFYGSEEFAREKGMAVQQECIFDIFEDSGKFIRESGN